MKKALCVLIFFVVAIACGCSPAQEQPYIAKIGSVTVYEPEFRFYFLLSQNAYESEGGSDIWLTTINGVKAEEVAKERAFASVTRVKVSGMQAEPLGIELDDEDKQIAADIADYYMEMLRSEDLSAIEMTSEAMRGIIEETVLYGKVFESVTKNVEISEKDFSAFYESSISSEPDSASVQGDRTTLELRETLRSQYTQKIKSEFFDEQYSKWETDIKIIKNNELWETIHILEH